MTALGIRVYTGLSTVIRTEECPMRRKVGSIILPIDYRLRLRGLADIEGDPSRGHKAVNIFLALELSVPKVFSARYIRYGCAKRVQPFSGVTTTIAVAIASAHTIIRLAMAAIFVLS